MKPQITDSSPPLSETEIQELEKKLGFNLPESYRRFLMETNGGIPKPNHFETETAVGSSLILSELDLSKSDVLDTFYAVTGIIPKHLITIGHDIFGNYIFLSLEGEDRGSLYFWIHDDPKMMDEYENLLIDKLDFIASDFEEFINSFSHSEYTLAKAEDEGDNWFF